MRRIPRAGTAVDAIADLVATRTTKTWTCRSCQLRQSAGRQQRASLTTTAAKSAWLPWSSNKEAAVQEEAAAGSPLIRETRNPYAAYKPAKTWDGLERVGNQQHLEETLVGDEEGRFEGFIASEKTQDNNAIVAALHRAIVEVHLLKELGLPLISLSHLPSLDELDWTSRVKIKPAANGPFTLEFPASQEREDVVSAIREAITRAVAEAEAEAEAAQKEDIEARRREKGARRRGQTQGSVEQDEERLASEEAQQAQHFEPDTAAAVEAEGKTMFQDEDAAVLEMQHEIEDAPAAKAYALSKEEFSNLRQVSLANLPTRFAVYKRLLQLTGIKLSDPSLASSKTAGILFSKLITPPPPKKLFEAIEKDTRFKKLPNVKVSSRRVTSVDQHMSLGRWKVIERELEARGIPAKGRITEGKMVARQGAIV